MCYRPITIYNNSLYFNPEYSQLKRTVPCGSCPDCQRSQSNSWFVRSVQEFKDCVGKGGMVIFPTLTFSNDNLPHIDFTLDNIKYNVPCFDMHLVNNFIKSFKIHLQRGIPYLNKKGKSTGNYRVRPISDVSGIRYLICSEYGKYTKRPHHHALLYLPFKMSEWDLLLILRRAWPHGFVGISSKLGLQIKSYKGIRYTSKYVCKDLSFYSNNKLKDYYKYIRKQAQFDPSLESELKRIRQHLPYHRQSLFFGLNIIKDLEEPKYLNYLIKNCISIPCQPYISKDGKQHISEDFPIPSYIKHKLTHNRKGFKCGDRYIYEKTETGYQYSEYLLNKQLDSFELKLKTFYADFTQIANSIPSNRVVFPSSLSSDTEKFNYLVDLDSTLDYFKNTFPNQLNSIDIHDLSIFRYCYRNLINLDIPFDSAFDVSLYDIRPHCEIDEFSINAHPSQRKHDTFKSGFEFYYFILHQIETLDMYINNYKSHVKTTLDDKKNYNKYLTTNYSEICSEIIP